MTLTINLTPAEKEQLLARALEIGPEADAFLANSVRQALPPHTEPDKDETPAPGESLYDLLKDHIGTVNSGGDGTLSQNTGKAFTDYVVEKHRQGKL